MAWRCITISLALKLSRRAVKYFRITWAKQQDSVSEINKCKTSNTRGKNELTASKNKENEQ